MIATAPSRDDPATMTCPLCQAYFTPVGRQIYCSTACRKAAFRRRQQSPAATVTIPAARPRRDYTVYECPDCGERLYGEQRCPGCGSFARKHSAPRIVPGWDCGRVDHRVTEWSAV